MAGNTKMLPGALLNEDGTYGASTQQIADLNKYVWTGVLLPTKEEDYKKRCGLTEIKPKLQSDVTLLLSTYTTIQANSVNFKDNVYPKIVDLASSVYSYAARAGGANSKSSYYNLIIQQVLLIDAENDKPSPDQTVIDKAARTVNSLVDAEVKSIDALVANATQVVKDLGAYESVSKTDKTNLDVSVKAIDDKLAGAGGEIATITAQIEAKKKELEADQAEYEQDVIISTTSLTYAWCWPVGTVIATVIAGYYGDKAVKMLDTIKAIKELLSTSRKELAADVAMLADCKCIAADLQTIFTLIGPAITAIEKMKGEWQAVKEDLKDIKENCKGAGDTPIESILNTQGEYVMSQWNKLKVAADKYRNNAYVTTPTVKSLDQVAKSLAAPAA